MGDAWWRTWPLPVGKFRLFAVPTMACQNKRIWGHTLASLFRPLLFLHKSQGSAPPPSVPKDKTGDKKTKLEWIYFSSGMYFLKYINSITSNKSKLFQLSFYFFFPGGAKVIAPTRCNSTTLFPLELPSNPRCNIDFPIKLGPFRPKCVVEESPYKKGCHVAVML